MSGEVGYLPQNLVLDTELRVDAALGIDTVREALHAIEAGDVGEERFAAVGDDWDVEERARAALDGLGLGHIGLDRTIGEMSGGECVMLRLAALLLARPDVLLLDEPTNNLDLYARQRLYAAIDAWHGVLVVVSHDRELLERVDQIADLRDSTVTWYGGNLSAYEAALAVEQEAAERMVRVAEADVQRQKRELAESQVRSARRRRYGQKLFDEGSVPKIVASARKRSAQESAGKQRLMHASRLRPTRRSAWTRPSRRCATTTRSGSSCRAPRSIRAGASWCCATWNSRTGHGCGDSTRCAVRSASRWWGATGRARPRCCARSPVSWPPCPARR